MKLGIPRLGIYSSAIKEFFESLGVEVVMPPKVTQEIILPGLMNSSDMMCYPYKVTLGQQIYCLEHGATGLVMYDTCGLCRFKHYHQIQEHTLRQLGYSFTMHTLSLDNLLPKLMEIGGASYNTIMKAMAEMMLWIEEAEKKAYTNRDSDIRVGIIGEVYTCWENDINLDIVKKLQDMGVAVHLSITLSEFVKKVAHLDLFDKRKEKKEALKLLSQEIGGHGLHSIYNTAWYGRLGFDGVVHLMPLSCMPESTVEPLIDYVADKYQIAIYRFPIDENLFEVGFNTRLETFISMLKRRRR